MSRKGIARVGDTASGICRSHTQQQSVTGTITTGWGNGSCDGLAIARVGDIVTFSCGHTGIITTGTQNSNCDGIAIATIDSDVGPGTGNITAKITSCSGNMEAE